MTESGRQPAAYIPRFQALCDLRGEKHHVCGAALFRVSNRVARAIGPIVQAHVITSDEAVQIRAHLGAMLAWWTGGTDESGAGDWYAVICDHFTPLEQMSAKHRSEVRRGLKNCTVRRLDADFVSAHGYPVYVKAFERYRGRAALYWTEPQFRSYFERARDFDDITHFWGVFHGEELITLAANDIYGKIEATYWMIKVNADYLKLYPVYALLHTMNEYYLATEGFQYVNDGWRSLVHESNIQSFLIEKFGFQKCYRRLCVNYAPLLRLAVAASFPFAAALSRLDARLAAIYALEGARRAAH